jgi:hypothetical protein
MPRFKALNITLKGLAFVAEYKAKTLIIKINFKMSTKLENKDLTSNDAKPMLYAFSKLSESKLKIAFHLLFGEEWRKYQPDKDKAEEMKAIFKGGVKPCVSFENWVKCIDFLRDNCI